MRVLCERDTRVCGERHHGYRRARRRGYLLGVGVVAGRGFCGASYAGPAAVSAAQPFGCLARLPKLSLFPSAQQRSLPGAAECTIDSSALDRY